MAQCLQAQATHVCPTQSFGKGEETDDSDKHSTFSTTFPIYILERSTKDIPVAPETPAGDGPDELEDDLDTDDKTKYEWVSEWVRVNDKAPIWMRLVISLLMQN
jgi:hypothetical protein